MLEQSKLEMGDPRNIANLLDDKHDKQLHAREMVIESITNQHPAQHPASLIRFQVFFLLVTLRDFSITQCGDEDAIANAKALERYRSESAKVFRVID